MCAACVPVSRLIERALLLTEHVSLMKYIIMSLPFMKHVKSGRNTLMTPDGILVSSSVSAETRLTHLLLPLYADHAKRKSTVDFCICIPGVMAAYIGAGHSGDLVSPVQIKTSFMQFTCARKCAKTKHSP